MGVHSDYLIQKGLVITCETSSLLNMIEQKQSVHRYIQLVYEGYIEVSTEQESWVIFVQIANLSKKCRIVIYILILKAWTISCFEEWQGICAADCGSSEVLQLLYVYKRLV